jgi:hypothetical protein
LEQFTLNEPTTNRGGTTLYFFSRLFVAVQLRAIVVPTAFAFLMPIHRQISFQL